jgi:hypothetical protein
MVINRSVWRPLLAGVATSLLIACGSSGDSDDSPQQFDAEALGGTWLMSADYTWQLDDTAFATRGEETMRTVVHITVDDPNRATVRSCYPGMGEQQVTVADNEFAYRLFDAPVTFTLESEGSDAPRIDFVTGAPILPGPASTRKVSAQTTIDASSGAVALLGNARLIKISNDPVDLTAATITFANEAALDVSLECFTQITRSTTLAGEASTGDLQHIIARGSQLDTLLDVDLQIFSVRGESSATVLYADPRRTRRLENTGEVTQSLLATDGAKLSFSLPLDNDEGSAQLTVEFDPAAD